MQCAFCGRSEGVVLQAHELLRRSLCEVCMTIGPEPHDLVLDLQTGLPPGVHPHQYLGQFEHSPTLPDLVSDLRSATAPLVVEAVERAAHSGLAPSVVVVRAERGAPWFSIEPRNAATSPLPGDPQSIIRDRFDPREFILTLWVIPTMGQLLGWIPRPGTSRNADYFAWLGYERLSDLRAPMPSAGAGAKGYLSLVEELEAIDAKNQPQPGSTLFRFMDPTVKLEPYMCMMSVEEQIDACCELNGGEVRKWPGVHLINRALSLCRGRLLRYVNPLMIDQACQDVIEFIRSSRWSPWLNQFLELWGATKVLTGDGELGMALIQRSDRTRYLTNTWERSHGTIDFCERLWAGKTKENSVGFRNPAVQAEFQRLVSRLGKSTRPLKDWTDSEAGGWTGEQTAAIVNEVIAGGWRIWSPSNPDWESDAAGDQDD